MMISPAIQPAVQPIAPPAPAAELVQRYGDQLTALGAASVTVVDPTTVAVVYTDNFKGVQAAGAFKDSIDGVRLLVGNRSHTTDVWEATGENVARWLEQSSIVETVNVRETFPLQLGVVATNDANAYALDALLRDELADGTTVSVPVRYH